MPLTMLNPGEEGLIVECRAQESSKRFLENLGIVPGVTVSIINEINGNIILSVKGARIALSKGLAQQLIIRQNR
ncbi:FeoA family protein [Syntrophobotulus glycolicus DSM 8271]|uniref:FeoA family protein n=1 Tax=Syntrophobotulus glycolicus (strain DSM 8271 / FlGlyR) TaxID=645991 RepID=F0SVL2_SYNGF|nr:FeoA family protein [Syntrophobotulus glycolicus]ADY54488.1 FeoA family protein [Syntrophobotulus glycolicus DSM 8271]